VERCIRSFGSIFLAVDLPCIWVMWNNFARAAIGDIRIGVLGGRTHGPDAQVLDSDGARTPGRHAAGELAEGIFCCNYPGSTGLSNDAVFGRVARTRAARS